MKMKLALTTTVLIFSAATQAAVVKCDGIDFDPEAYLICNYDVKAAGVDACGHWTHFGKKEKRIWNCAEANADREGTTSDACKRGPTIEAISNISSKGLTALFDGVEVYRIKYAIKDSTGKEVGSGIIKPEHNKPSIAYSQLADGTYTLSFKGDSCASQASEKSFTVSGAGGSSSASSSTMACKRGPQIGELSNISSSGLNVKFDGEGVTKLNYKISLISSDGSPKEVVSSFVNPQNNTPKINFGKTLAAGSYSIVLFGENCAEGNISKAKTFNIDQNASSQSSPAASAQ